MDIITNVFLALLRVLCKLVRNKRKECKHVELTICMMVVIKTADCKY